MIDVVVPAHEKDFGTLPRCVRSILRHVRPLRRVHVVSAQRFEMRDDRVRWVAEPGPPAFPALEEVRERWAASHPETADRAGWVYQQLLKLGARDYVPDLSPSYLVVDADVIFLRATGFDTEQLGRFPYSVAFEHHPAYRAAYERLLGSPPTAPFSLTAHHMLYDRELIGELQAEIAERHGARWHSAYLDAVDKAEPSSISEMDIYGWWVLDRHPEHARRRQLVWRDVQRVPGPVGRAVIGLDYDFVAAHAWLRRSAWVRARGTVARIGGELVAPLRR
jgi:hypothetical protein